MDLNQFSDLNSDESKLRQYMMTNYAPDIRPVANASSITYVNITLSNLQIMNLDEQNQVMVASAQIILQWYDEFLQWDPLEYMNQTNLAFTARDVWTPDIVLFNSADIAYSTQRDNYLLDIQYDGNVRWIFPDLLRSYCAVDIRFFPFDSQNCVLEFQSWSRSKHEILVVNDQENYGMNTTFIHTEWNIVNITVNQREKNEFVWLEYNLHLKRNSAFYVNHMIFPFIVLSSLSLFVFWLPPDSGEKITLIITILLALTVFLQLITQYTPKAAKSLPIIGLYFNVNLILVLISVILTIIVLNLHYRGPKNQRVPKWVRVYIIGYLGQVFCFCNESRNFMLNELVNKKKDKILIPKKKLKKNLKNQNSDSSNRSSDEYGFREDGPNCHYKLYSNQNHVYNLSRSCTYVEMQNEIDPSNSNIKQINSVHSITNQKSVTMTKRDRKKFSNFNNSKNLYKNLEKLTSFLCKSFKTIKMQDENLRLLLLDEIVECQHNLLIKNKKLLNSIKLEQEMKKSNKLKNMNNAHIYDEWKVLAMFTLVEIPIKFSHESNCRSEDWR
ncbi:neuronal acetylcholine receptor subunit alpha-10-like [Brachionus plicatilis]|uniref:Neuronal acetylcholine receptor subunit alpha-10-like n=1 Tax=Brachionus plicatilis TaxID=10195 RepID=A0A3M7RC54_BRAPC|nr:neuronal acetylcholine receptor subunit alpha-10-like [Brachionus plicatilis]